MKLKKVVFFVFISFILMLIVSCSNTNSTIKTEPVKTAKKTEIPETVKEITIDSSHKIRPEWLVKRIFIKDNVRYFVGGDMDYKDYALGVSSAKHLAMLELASSIRNKVRAITGYAQAGDPKEKDKISRIVEDYIATFVNNIGISGVSESEVYYRKYVSYNDTTPKYQIFVKIGIKASDYRKAVEESKKELRNKYKEINDPLIRKKLEDIQENLTE